MKLKFRRQRAMKLRFRRHLRLQKKQVDISVYGGAYGELFKNLELARYQYLKDIPLLQVIDEPRYPMKKIKRGRLLTGLMFAIGASLLTAFILVVSRPGKKFIAPVS